MAENPTINESNPSESPSGQNEAAIGGTPEVQDNVNPSESVTIDQAQVPTKPAQDDPRSFIPEKFHVKGDDGTFDLQATMRKQTDAYKSLEQRLGSGGEDQQEATETVTETSEESVGGDTEETSDTAEKSTETGSEEATEPKPQRTVEDFNNKISKWSEHILEKDGNVTDDEFTAMAEEFGEPKEVVQEYVQNALDARQFHQDQLINSVGGDDAANKMFEWASSAMAPKELEGLQKGLDSWDRNARQQSFETIKQKFDDAHGVFNKRPDGGSNVTAGDGALFEDAAEVQAAMGDPRYQSDPAYRRAVEDKVRRSMANNKPV